MKTNILLNIGCGMTPTKGFENYDNSFSLKLSRYPLFSAILYKLQLISKAQMDYIDFCKKNNIKWANAIKHIPQPSDSASLLYTSHMLEHLDRAEAAFFLKEALRVLKPGGKIRLAVPDLSKVIEQYNQDKDADAFVESTLMCIPNPRSLFQKLRIGFIGNRHHLWMYDGNSLLKLLEKNGFTNAAVMLSGETSINDLGSLDLSERSEESTYVEAVKPLINDDCKSGE